MCLVLKFLYLVPWVLWLLPRGIFLDLVALMARRWACNSGSHKTVTIGEAVLGRLLPPGLCGDSRLKYTSSISVKEAYLQVLEFGP